MMEKVYDMFYGAPWIVHKQAKDLRKRQTKAENILWNLLSNKQLGVKFRRQHPINVFIADFYCHEIKLVVEIDGEIHQQKDRMAYDLMRTEVFNGYGIHVIRFKNLEVFQNSYKIVLSIQNLILKLKDSKI